MCGPSAAMKNLNSTVQQFSTQVNSEAGTVFGNSNGVFNNIMNGVQGIVAGGPSQQGIVGPELTSLNSAAGESGATMTRNLEGASETSGGNVATAAGGNLATTLNAEQTGAATTAGEDNATRVRSGQVGRANFAEGTEIEKQAPNVFGGAGNFNQTASDTQQLAEKSQQNQDTQKNWWKSPVMSLAAQAAQFIPVVGPAVSMAISDVNQNYQQEQKEANQDVNFNPQMEGSESDSGDTSSDGSSQ